MSVLSMALCTTVFAWAPTRPAIRPLYRTVLIPALGLFGVLVVPGTSGLGEAASAREITSRRWPPSMSLSVAAANEHG
jgi:hypothetical protein